MDTRDLQVLIKGDASDFKRAMDDVEKKSGGLKGAMDSATTGSFALLAGITALGIGAVAFGNSAVQAFNEAQLAQASLEHAVVGVTHATNEQLQQTMALSDALEKKGVLDGDNIKMGLAQLSTFGLSNKAVQNLGGSLADLAVNQFGVNASGEQLSQTANMIAKALNGQFGVLEKSGIRFTEAQKAIIQFGTEEQKVTAINEGFAQNLKLTNEVARQTAAGGIAHMQVQLGNVQEAIGGLIMNGISPIINAISNWIDSMGGADGIMAMLTQKVKEIQPYFPIIAGAIIGGLVPAFVAMGAAIWTAMAPLIPFIAAGAAIGLLVKIIVDRLGGWDATMKKMQPVIDWFKSAWEQIVNIWNQYLLPALKMLWNEFETKLLPALQKLWQEHGPQIIMVLQALAVIFGVVILSSIVATIAVIYVLINVFTAIVNAVTWVGSEIKRQWQMIVDGWNQTVAMIQASVNAFVVFFQTLPQNIGFIIGSIIRFWWDLPANIANGVMTIINWLSQLPGRAYAIASSMVGAIGAWFNQLPGRGQAAGQGLVSGFISFLQQLPGMVGGIFNNVVNTISGWAGQLFNRARDIAGKFWEGFKQGLGIHSPSYIEKAFMAIGLQSTQTLAQMDTDMNKLNNISFGNFNTLLGPGNTGGSSSTTNNNSAQNNRIEVNIMGNASGQEVQDGLLGGLRLAQRGI